MSWLTQGLIFSISFRLRFSRLINSHISIHYKESLPEDIWPGDVFQNEPILLPIFQVLSPGHLCQIWQGVIVAMVLLSVFWHCLSDLEGGKMMLWPGSHQCRESSLKELSIAPEMKETWNSNPQLKVFEWETLPHASSFDISIHLNIIRSILIEGRRVNGDRWRNLADALRWDFRHPWYLDGVDELLLVWTYISVCITVMV